MHCLEIDVGDIFLLKDCKGLIEANRRGNLSSHAPPTYNSVNVGIDTDLLLVKDDAAYSLVADFAQCHHPMPSSTPPLSCHSSLLHRWCIQGFDQHARKNAMGRSFKRAQRGGLRSDQDLKYTHDSSGPCSYAQEDVR